ncbi:MAG: hypothetical protein HQL58_12550 [Magnetococcales bacterium]|nr:hypothetical protein [Magnetococcales bacterium]
MAKKNQEMTKEHVFHALIAAGETVTAKIYKKHTKCFLFTQNNTQVGNNLMWAIFDNSDSIYCVDEKDFYKSKWILTPEKALELIQDA